MTIFDTVKLKPFDNVRNREQSKPEWKEEKFHRNENSLDKSNVICNSRIHREPSTYWQFRYSKSHKLLFHVNIHLFHSQVFYKNGADWLFQIGDKKIYRLQRTISSASNSPFYSFIRTSFKNCFNIFSFLVLTYLLSTGGPLSQSDMTHCHHAQI